MDKGNLRLGALSGALQIDRHDPKIQETENLLEWVYFSGADVGVTQEPDGKIQADRPETEEKFRAFFEKTGLRSFHALLLNDEEGKLGVLAFMRKSRSFWTKTSRTCWRSWSTRPRWPSATRSSTSRFRCPVS